MRRVAVTGLGVVSPIGVGRAAFYHSLANGRPGIARISRFECSGFQARLAAEVKDELDLPDEVRAVAQADPKVGFGWAACAEALHGAGVTRLGADTLVHLGVGLESFDPRRGVAGGRTDLPALAARDLAPGAPALRLPLDAISRLLRLRLGRPGRSLVNCSACAAAAQAVGHAFHAIRSGAFERALCGGLDSMINPLGVGGFQLLGALVPGEEPGPRACRPFDANRAGVVLGEGAAALVLEPLEKARAEGRPVLAEVVGYGASLDATSLSAPDPAGGGAARSMLSALADARMPPEAVGHVEAHGTGTWLNDPVEAGAIRRVFQGCWERLPVSAGKSQTGHLMAAAGAMGAAVCLFVLDQGLVPSNIGLDKPGKGCELNHTLHGPSPFAGEATLCNAFGFGGQNATFIFRRSPA